jgi:hypothetical protein
MRHKLYLFAPVLELHKCADAPFPAGVQQQGNVAVQQEGNGVAVHVQPKHLQFSIEKQHLS